MIYIYRRFVDLRQWIQNVDKSVGITVHGSTQDASSLFSWDKWYLIKGILHSHNIYSWKQIPKLQHQYYTIPFPSSEIGQPQ